MRVVFVYLFLIVHSLFSLDFHDFDIYQNKFTCEEVDLKIKTYLEKDPAIRKFYQLTPQVLYVGDLQHQQIDYALHLNAPPPFASEESPNADTPIVTPRKTYCGLKGVKIAIDPGHFGGVFAELEQRYVKIPKENTRNNEAICIYEGDLTYLTAIELKRLLEAEGAEILITRSNMGQGVIEEDFFTWLNNHGDLKKSCLSLSELFRNYYNKEDLKKRAEKINDFSPDITIVIHYNVHLTKESEIFFTQSNYSLAFIPGAFCSEELKNARDRYEFLRLIVTDNLEESLRISECIIAQFVDQLNVPMIANEKAPYLDTACIFQRSGVYSRNLVLTRLIHSPVCYGETLVQDNEDEAYRLSFHDISIAGIPCSSRIQEVAQAYFEGIKKYFTRYTAPGLK